MGCEAVALRFRRNEIKRRRIFKKIFPVIPCVLIKYFESSPVKREQEHNTSLMRKRRIAREDSASCKFQLEWKNVKPYRPFYRIR